MDCNRSPFAVRPSRVLLHYSYWTEDIYVPFIIIPIRLVLHISCTFHFHPMRDPSLLQQNNSSQFRTNTKNHEHKKPSTPKAYFAHPQQQHTKNNPVYIRANKTKHQITIIRCRRLSTSYATFAPAASSAHRYDVVENWLNPNMSRVTCESRRRCLSLRYGLLRFYHRQRLRTRTQRETMQESESGTRFCQISRADKTANKCACVCAFFCCCLRVCMCVFMCMTQDMRGRISGRTREEGGRWKHARECLLVSGYI